MAESGFSKVADLKSAALLEKNQLPVLSMGFGE